MSLFLHLALLASVGCRTPSAHIVLSLIRPPFRRDAGWADGAASFLLAFGRTTSAPSDKKNGRTRPFSVKHRAAERFHLVRLFPASGATTVYGPNEYRVRAPSDATSLRIAL